MKGEKFDLLSRSIISEESVYVLNDRGVELMKRYHSIANTLQNGIYELIKHITKNPVQVSKRMAVQFLAEINSREEYTKELEIMIRIYSLTNGGASEINYHNTTFNNNDEILNYLDKK